MDGQGGQLDQNMMRLFLTANAQLPKFSGKKTDIWRAFESTFRLRLVNSGLEHFPLVMQKRSLLSCLEGNAARAHILLGEGTAAWNNALDMNTFLNSARELFQPPAESELARIEFESLKQGVNQPISAYHSAKMVAYHQAVPQVGNHNFAYLRTQMLRGVYSPYVRQ